MSKPTADWVRVGDCFYRKIQLYSDVFDEDLELEHYTVIGAPYSGAVGKHFSRRQMDSADIGSSTTRRESNLFLPRCTGVQIDHRHI